jgi:hypothetical protein
MGFMDKMKSAAQDAATQAKKATSSAQTKMEESQVKKKMDESAKKLGYLIYRERTQGTPAGADADAAISEMQGFEQKIHDLQTQAAAAQEEEGSSPPSAAPAPEATPTAPPPSTPSTSSSEPTGGDFKL